MKKILIILTILLSTSVMAQVDTVKVDTLQTIELSGVTVTGVRAGINMPVSETTVKSSEIRKTYQGGEVPMILSTTPSVTTYTDGGHPQGYTYFRIRGIDQTRINMTLNGVPLNEPEDQGVYFSNYPGFTNNIGSMQIQRGVGTSTNGTSSYGGSINFESPTGFKKGTDIEYGYGSFNSHRFNARYSSGLDSNKIAFTTNFSTFSTDGYKYNSGSNGYSFFMSGGYYGDKDIVKLTAFTGKSTNQMSWFAVSEVDIENDPRTNYNTPVEDDNFKQSFVQLQYTRELSRKSLLTSTIYYNRLDGEWDLDLGNFGAGPDVLNYQLASNFYGIMTNYKYTGSKLRLNIGAHANMYDREHGMAILPLTTERLYTNTGYKNEMSGFLKAGYDIGKLTLFGDAQLRHATFRYDGDVAMDNLEWTFFNPKAGLVYNMCKHWRFYGSVGQSHREPTRNDMFMGEDNLVEYTEVTPEEVVDYELGFGYQGKKFKVKTNGYYMDFKNEITLIGALGSNGLPLMTNVENSFRLGSETEISYQIVKTLKIYNNTNVSYNRITDGGQEFQPLYTPPVVSNTGLMFEYKNFFVGMSAKYHSESFIDFANENVTPSFVLLNADMGVTYNKFTLTGKLVNITNERYFTNGYSDGTQNYFFVNAPLSGYVTLKMSL